MEWGFGGHDKKKVNGLERERREKGEKSEVHNVLGYYSFLIHNRLLFLLGKLFELFL